jgi:hypothetical protein
MSRSVPTSKAVAPGTEVPTSTGSHRVRAHTGTRRELLVGTSVPGEDLEPTPDPAAVRLPHEVCAQVQAIFDRAARRILKERMQAAATNEGDEA